MVQVQFQTKVLFIVNTYFIFLIFFTYFGNINNLFSIFFYCVPIFNLHYIDVLLLIHLIIYFYQIDKISIKISLVVFNHFRYDHLNFTVDKYITKWNFYGVIISDFNKKKSSISSINFESIFSKIYITSKLNLHLISLMVPFYLNFSPWRPIFKKFSYLSIFNNNKNRWRDDNTNNKK